MSVMSVQYSVLCFIPSVSLKVTFDLIRPHLTRSLTKNSFLTSVSEVFTSGLQTAGYHAIYVFSIIVLPCSHLNFQQVMSLDIFLLISNVFYWQVSTYREFWWIELLRCFPQSDESPMSREFVHCFYKWIINKFLGGIFDQIW